MNELIISKDYWLSSELSIARFYGGIKINGRQYDILPPHDDLVCREIKDAYQFFGRQQIIDFLNKKMSIKEIKLLMIDERKNRKAKSETKKAVHKERSLF